MDDPMRKALVQVQGIFAELDKSLLVKKLRKSREAIRATGKKCERRPSYKHEAKDLLDRIRRMRRKPKGSGKRRMSFRMIAEQLNLDGVASITGKEFSGPMIQNLLQRAKG